MHFNLKQTDGPGRVGEFIIDKKRVITPNIFFVNSTRFKGPDFSDAYITSEKKIIRKPMLKITGSFFTAITAENNGDLSVPNYLGFPKDVPRELQISSMMYKNEKFTNCYIIPGNKEINNDILVDNNVVLFIIANAIQLLSHQSQFVEFITELREKIGHQRLLYLPSLGEPSNFALFTYMGIDFFDSISAILAARNNLLLFPEGRYDKNTLDELPCSCPICNKLDHNSSDISFSQILHHNYIMLIDEIRRVRNAIITGSLRELVELRVHSTPSLTAVLRILDHNHYRYLEERTPITKQNQLIATTKEAIYRPEIRRFQQRVINRYQKPKSTKVLLLLPCSAIKPYSFSKSHKLFRETLLTMKNPNILHEVIITSPLGVVPRELELTYPASNYDIPVTGIWDEDEKTIIKNILQRYLMRNVYDKVIIHLPQSLQETLVEIIDTPIITCNDKPTSKKSLQKLSEVLRTRLDAYTFIKKSDRARENIESLLCFQFGKENANRLIKGCNITGKYPYQKLIYQNNQIGMLTRERGLISLTLNGAERIVEAEDYWVDIYDDFILKGSLFAPGVKNADSMIRIGDEVIILQNKKLIGVGVAQMNGEEMKERSKGEAVKIRHLVN